eukprot:gene21625-biopygen1829
MSRGGCSRPGLDSGRDHPPRAMSDIHITIGTFSTPVWSKYRTISLKGMDSTVHFLMHSCHKEGEGCYYICTTFPRTSSHTSPHPYMLP